MKRVIYPVLYLLLVCSSTTLWAQSKEAFILSIYDQYTRLSSPPQMDGKFTLILENKSLSQIIGVVKSADGQNKRYVALAPDQTSSQVLDNPGRQKFSFYPLSPGLPEVELVSGLGTYEIPARK